jgi:hypothetical protein
MANWRSQLYKIMKASREATAQLMASTSGARRAQRPDLAFACRLLNIEQIGGTTVKVDFEIYS